MQTQSSALRDPLTTFLRFMHIQLKCDIQLFGGFRQEKIGKRSDGNKEISPCTCVLNVQIMNLFLDLFFFRLCICRSIFIKNSCIMHIIWSRGDRWMVQSMETLTHQWKSVEWNRDWHPVLWGCFWLTYLCWDSDHTHLLTCLHKCPAKQSEHTHTKTHCKQTLKSTDSFMVPQHAYLNLPPNKFIFTACIEDL